VLWGAASLYRAVDLAFHSVRLRRLWKSATPVETGQDSAIAGGSHARLWGRKAVQVCTTDALDRPSVIGFLAPRILIPGWLFSKLTPAELEQILLHETEHLRRGDDWTNLLQKLSLIVFPLNPVLLWIERRLCLEREMACDEAVIRVTGAPRAYATCLTNLAERGLQRRTEALSLGAWQRRPELVRRVHSILLSKPALGPGGTRGVLAVLVCGLAFGSVELARCPQLVAFTPVRQRQMAHAPVHVLSRTPVAAGMVNARFVEPPASSAHAKFAGKPYLMELKAAVPARLAVPHIYSDDFQQASIKTAAKKTTPEHSIPARASVSSRQAPRPDALQAAVSAPEQEQQGWLVLTTWEEVSSSDQETAQADITDQPAVTDQASPASDRRTTQMRVTQLVFRVVPASSVSTSPTAIPIRSSWFVIQL